MNKNIINLESSLKNRIFGQDNVIEEVVNTLYISMAGLQELNKPIASFLFTGSTGVGKTELVKELAKELDMHLERFDMSEYADEYSARNLTGGQKGLVGYEDGGLLTNAIKNNPNSILLLDEVEKAHKDIYNTFLQVLDYGTLTDTKGEKVDFSKTIIIMTSNLGVEEKLKVNEFMTPEFRNRIDKILNFNNLTKELSINIITKFLNDFSQTLKKQNIQLTITDRAKEYLNDIGFDPKMGARSVKRAINNEFKTHISKEILFGKLRHGGKVSIDYITDNFIYSYSDTNRAKNSSSNSFKTPFDKDFIPSDFDFETYEESMSYAKNNPNISITRASSGYGYIINK